MTWIERVAANILPLSKERRNVAEALREWVYTGDCYDLDAPIEDCQLCNHPNIRYQFVIFNQHMGETLLIGSECITRFRIPAVDDKGNILSDEATKVRVKQDRSRLITDAKRRRMMNTLVRLASVDGEFDIQSFIDYFDERNAFTPKQLSLLFWRLDKVKVAYSKADFKMVIRRKREKEQLLAMPDWKLKKLRPAMSSSQLEWCITNKG